MSELLTRGVDALNERLGDGGFSGSLKFNVTDEGVVIVDKDGARQTDGDADCTITASSKTFIKLLEGKLNPATAVMSGKLRVAGDMSTALRFAAMLS
ncbi:MAG: SCP2 sterol-binding domain-containing protein [Pseudomonadota bacterium]